MKEEKNKENESKRKREDIERGRQRKMKRLLSVVEKEEN